ncbi:MAG: hypothetical protein EBZ66_02120, partial [Actinobacteria bacterium]|nr:hypothetical protein [Actinomycetota bacterium]
MYAKPSPERANKKMNPAIIIKVLETFCVRREKGQVEHYMQWLSELKSRLVLENNVIKKQIITGGALKDVAPTVLDILGNTPPIE